MSPLILRGYCQGFLFENSFEGVYLSMIYGYRTDFFCILWELPPSCNSPKRKVVKGPNAPGRGQDPMHTSFPAKATERETCDCIRCTSGPRWICPAKKHPGASAAFVAIGVWCVSQSISEHQKNLGPKFNKCAIGSKIPIFPYNRG